MHIYRGLFIVVALALCCAPAFAETAQQSDLWICPRQYAGQTLSVYNWTTYIAEDTISNFEQLCDVTLNYNTYASDTDMLDELRQGNPGYDVVVPTDATVYLMIDEGLLQPLNFARIPNAANINARFKNPPYDPDSAYTVPYQWGTVGIGYNRTALGRDIHSWNDLFDNPGAVAWLDESRSMLGFALNVLGYNPNTTSQSEIEAARQYLIDHSSNVAEIAPDTGQDLLAAGQVQMAVEYSGDIFQIINDCKCDDYDYVIPDEGALIWIDNLAIPTGAPNEALAEVFIDYLLNAQVGADISNYTAYASPNQKAIDEDLIDGTYLHNPAIYPDDALLSKLFFIVSDASIEQSYNDAWDAVKLAVGR
jgi:spermidine/putrescine transport system substrate-binding protein